MLTDREKEWLERRERHESPFCISCDALRTAVDGVGYCYPIEDCPLEARIEDWQNAAEFEARVVEKLANYIESLGWKSCGKYALKAARLQVEEEIDV